MKRKLKLNLSAAVTRDEAIPTAITTSIVEKKREKTEASNNLSTTRDDEKPPQKNPLLELIGGGDLEEKEEEEEEDSIEEQVKKLETKLEEIKKRTSAKDLFVIKERAKLEARKKDFQDGGLNGAFFKRRLDELQRSIQNYERKLDDCNEEELEMERLLEQNEAVEGEEEKEEPKKAVVYHLPDFRHPERKKLMEQPIQQQKKQNTPRTTATPSSMMSGLTASQRQLVTKWNRLKEEEEKVIQEKEYQTETLQGILETQQQAINDWLQSIDPDELSKNPNFIPLGNNRK